MTIFLYCLCMVLLGIVIWQHKRFQELRQECSHINGRLKRSSALFSLMNEWVKAKIDGRKIETFFEKRGWHRIALYGIGNSGVDKRLYEDLMSSDIKIMYAIDSNPNEVVADVDVYSPDDDLEPVDVVVVTAVHYFEEIKNSFEPKVDCPVISLMQVFDGIKIPIEESTAKIYLKNA